MGGKKNELEIELFSCSSRFESLFSSFKCAGSLSVSFCFMNSKLSLIAGLMCFSENNCFPKGLNSQNG